MVALLGIDQGSAKRASGILGVEPDGLGVVGQGAFGVAALVMSHTPGDKSWGLLGTQMDGLVKISDSLLQITQLNPNQASAYKCLGLLRVRAG